MADKDSFSTKIAAMEDVCVGIYISLSVWEDVNRCTYRWEVSNLWWGRAGRRLPPAPPESRGGSPAVLLPRPSVRMGTVLLLEPPP